MLVDIILIILLVSAVFRGHEIGLVRQLLSTAGFIGGLFVGAALQPFVIGAANDVLTKAVLSLGLALVAALVFLTVGEYLGVLLKRRLQSVFHLNRADALLGSLAGGATLLLAVWLLAPSLSNLPDPSLKQSLRDSRIVGLLRDNLPSAPKFISSLDKFINPNGFPDVFAGIERVPIDDGKPLPQLGNLQNAVQKDRTSVVKLEGRGCGGIVEGSGFVARSGVVITNAHVVAGVERPTVIDANGQHSATPIWFDPQLDMAVLSVNGLAGQPLAISPARAPNGTATAVLGYPGGGSFRASAATVLDSFIATGHDIYGQQRTNRDIYELKADVIPGNSGGPLVNADGTVVGLIFAQSTTYQNIGYALTMSPVVSELNQALRQHTAVSTGACAE